MAPQRKRTCIMCRSPLDKMQGLRVVKNPDGIVHFDASNKADGRGAYVCGAGCFEKAIAQKRFAAALRTSITDEDYERISEELVSALSVDRA